MKINQVDQVARAILYEGYLLYPYRLSSIKNQQRWTFGGLVPRAYHALNDSEPWVMQAECLVEGSSANFEGVVRFLHLIQRRADRDEFVARQEAMEREVAVPPISIDELLAHPQRLEFAFPAQANVGPLRSPGGEIIGTIEDRQEGVTGTVAVSADRLGPTLYKLTARIENHTPLAQVTERSRDDVLRFGFVSTHMVLRLTGDARFVSLTEPASESAEAAALCRSVGCWPVLAGARGERQVMLASPIILPDYPEVAEESPGDLFDGTEIDEILTLRVLTLTDAERQEICNGDARGRALLTRTDALGNADLLAMHGTMRNVTAENRRVRVGTTELGRGDRVLLRPRGRSDVFDIALNGMTATIESVEQDFEDRLYVTVTLDDDPGRDLGVEGKPGHRFFFTPEEIVPLAPEVRP